MSTFCSPKSQLTERLFRGYLKTSEVNIRYSGSYNHIHQQFERERQISHSLTDCKERSRPVIVRRWTPEVGWRDVLVPWAGKVR